MVSKFIAFGCSHFPLQDDETLSIILDEIIRYDPDYIIHMGDIFEADAVSRFDTDYNWVLEDEFKAVGSFMKLLTEISPNSTKVLIEGNHDKNIRDWKRTGSKLVGLVDYRRSPHIEPILTRS